MKVPYYRINAFYDETSSNPTRAGNPAAIVLLTAEENDKVTDAQRQSLATELNLSETSYVVCHPAEKNTFDLRWFTPSCEVSLCGHATLAAARALYASSWACKDPIIFSTRSSGKLVVSLASDDDAVLTMQFPSITERYEIPEDVKAQLLQGLQVDGHVVKQVFQSRFDTVVQLECEEDVKNLAPDFNAVKNLPKPIARGVIVCAQSASGERDAEYDLMNRFVSRFFAPKVGIDEDPVTGSAHSVLIPMYLKHGERAIAVQLSNRRGKLIVKNQGDSVEIGGKTYIVAEGMIEL